MTSKMYMIQWKTKGTWPVDWNTEDYDSIETMQVPETETFVKKGRRFYKLISGHGIDTDIEIKEGGFMSEPEEGKVYEITKYASEEEVTRIEISLGQILFFNEREEVVHVIHLEGMPDFEKGEALNIKLKAKVLIER